jgi:hypothetical protein
MPERLSRLELPARPRPAERSRGQFVYDVLALQLKLLAGNVHNFILIPATLVAAFLDLVFKSGGHGARFYRVLEWGRQAEEAIGLYSALGPDGNVTKSDSDAEKDGKG